MREAFIFGSSGHASVITSIIYEKYDKINFIEKDIEDVDKNIILESEFYKNIDFYKKNDIYIGIGDNKIRTKIFKDLKNLNLLPKNCISKHAFVAHSATLGHGVFVGHGCVIGAKAKLGHNTIINTLSSIDHNCELGNHSQLTAGITFGGDVTMGQNCFVGMKSAIIPNIIIGNNTVIMAGSIVYKNLPDNVIVGGNPARIIKAL